MNVSTCWSCLDGGHCTVRGHRSERFNKYKSIKQKTVKDGRDKNVEFESEVGDTSTRYDRLVVNYYIKYKNDVILVLKSEYFMVSFLLCDSKLNIFGFWTKQDIWGRRLSSYNYNHIVHTVYVVVYLLHTTTVYSVYYSVVECNQVHLLKYCTTFEVLVLYYFHFPLRYTSIQFRG